MKFELALAATLTRLQEKPNSIASRKELRVRTDALIADGPIELVQAVERACEVMLSVGSILVKHGHEPHEADLIEAICADIENGRAVMDRGLTVDSEATAKCGAVMLELGVRGFLATLGVPYDRVMVEVHRARTAGEPPKVRELLDMARAEATEDAALRLDAARYRYIRDHDPYLFEEMGISGDAAKLDETVDWAMAGGRNRSPKGPS